MKKKLKSIIILTMIFLLLLPGLRILYKYVETFNKSYSIEIKDDVISRYVFDPSDKNAFLSGEVVPEMLNSKDVSKDNTVMQEYFDQTLKEYGFDQGFVDGYRIKQSQEFFKNETTGEIQKIGKSSSEIIGNMNDLKILYGNTDTTGGQTEEGDNTSLVSKDEEKAVEVMEKQGEDLELYTNDEYIRTKTGYVSNPETFKTEEKKEVEKSPEPKNGKGSNTLDDLKKIKIKILKNDFYSFESIYYNLVSAVPIFVDDLVIYVTRDKFIFPNVDGRTDYYVEYRDGAIRGAVNMGYNPTAGKYNIVVKSKSFKNWNGVSETFVLKRRKVPPLPKGFSVITMEYTTPLDNRRIIGPDGTEGGYENIANWLQYAQTNAFWMLVAQTTGWDGTIHSGSPWVKGGFSNLELLAPEMKKRGIDVGGYTMSFFTPGNGKKKIPEYHPSLGYDGGTDSILDSLHVSLIDEQRIKDLTDFAKKMDENPNVDYIGFDFIRTGEGDGYEMVDSAVEATNMRVPKGFWSYTFVQRVRWLARQVEVYKNPENIAKWRWWRASRVATVMNTIITKGNIHKPVWTFTLGWEHGLQHGQDPYMMFDAGVFVDSAMLYEASEVQFKNLLVQWHNYMKNSENNVIIGNSSDARLLDSTTNDMVHEYMYRNQKGVERIYKSDFAKGIFLHDITRALWSSHKKISTLEWMILFGSSTSHYRNQVGVIPYKVKIEMQNFKEATLSITNTSKTLQTDIKASFIPLSYWEEVKDNIPGMISLNPNETKIYKIEMKPKRGVGIDAIIAYKLEKVGYPTYFSFDKKNAGSNVQIRAHRFDGIQNPTSKDNEGTQQMTNAPANKDESLETKQSPEISPVNTENKNNTPQGETK